VGDDLITPHDADELARCFAAHAPRLFGHACVLARGDSIRAEDLVQATFQAAGQAWPTLRGLAAEQLRSWLWGTLAQNAANGLRREAESRGRPPRIEVRYRTAPPGPGEPAFSSITLERCWRTILAMTEPQYTAAIFRWQLDMKEAEIAAALGLAEKTVTALLDRARRKLVTQLGPDHPFTSDDPEGASS
jgi:RNA polymerase sigma factor (sigma-70 family)